ncbi:hypothetical protein LEP1GSC036_3349 [Leptospira weilii str. 2006001853]|uniref:Uncharacterized protein n=2 Tax=Leptospira weilii TaxID=28184 RepID=A0A828Z1C9_9LEPT|nr:hypothetical protein LEP1GSC036_3349 [Leptospira weilii str. 2006001853]EMJ67120.1 hypothetical protein LEP1GSC051_3717 [Leptospira sp. P2653]EMN44423.1 hypothetical protein LEP1GSC086_3507 [Leptospira weilii str. LNT 1234]EMN89284.1 hypothetical protein LEP1GSC108_4512 [Leptospira weilii str. UI 13098]OMI18055.1 hypothetical protein BUQ74_06705 [Leptospira weilii serovar Heyan]QDK23960.1 hypothetical protein FHG67_15505 [Leptospira weilii]
MSILFKKDFLIKLVNFYLRIQNRFRIQLLRLEASHFYESKREDLLNLIGSVSLNSSVYSKCSNRVDKPKEYKISKSNGC